MVSCWRNTLLKGRSPSWAVWAACVVWTAEEVGPLVPKLAPRVLAATLLLWKGPLLLFPTPCMGPGYRGAEDPGAQPASS